MLGIGFGEMILIAGVALVVIGPDKFPDFAKLVIRTVRDLRGYVDDVKSEVTKELSPLKKEMDSLSRIDPEKYIDSLTGGDDDEPGSNAVKNDDDRKVMEGTDESYSEDPYGWEESQDTTYGADKGAYPEETVGYGEEPSDETCDTENTGDEEKTEGDGGEGHESVDEVELGDDRIEFTDPGEPDVWTNR